MSNNFQPILLNVNEASMYLNMKVSWLRSAVFQRQIPFIKLGRLIRFDKKDLEKWIETNKNTLGAE